MPASRRSEVSLARLSPADEADFVSAVRASRGLHRPWIAPPDDYAAFAAYLERAAGAEHAAFLVRHRACGALVGFVNVNNVVRGAFQSASLGYAAFAGHEGAGLMTAGLEAVLDVAFGDLGLHRVEANIQPGNERSLALVRRLGFTREGFSPRMLFIEGAWRDHERWALTAERWPRRDDAPARSAGAPSHCD